jgi:integrase
LPKYKFPPRRILTKEEVATMINGADTPSLRALISFLYLYGLRIGEATALKKSDFSISGKRLKVNVVHEKQRQTGPIIYEHPMYVALSAPFMENVITYLKVCGEGRVWTQARQTYWRKIKRLNANCSAHIFRHTRATKLGQLTENPLALQDWFGWQRLETATKYVHAGGKLAAKLAGKID